jgi:hypothetical protein
MGAGFSGLCADPIRREGLVRVLVLDLSFGLRQL